MRTLVDSNVVLDFLSPASPWHAWAMKAVLVDTVRGPVLINPVVLAEVSVGFADPDEVDRVLPPTLFERTDLPCAAAFVAAHAYARYRRSGGLKSSPLPDFYIGAHAEITGNALLTRDVRRQRTYFPKVHLITPDA